MENQLVSIGLIGGSVSASAVLTALAWRQRPQPGAVQFAAMMAGATWWVATSAVGLFTLQESRRLLLHELEWVGQVVVPLAWFLFALEYTSRDEYVTPRNVALLSVVPVVTVFLAATNDVHGLVYTAVDVAVYDEISIIERSFGPWFWVYTVYTYTLLGAGAALIFQLLTGIRTVYRGQAFALLIAVLAPWVGSLLFVTGSSPVPNLDFTPFTFLITGVTGIAALTQFELLDAVPVSSRAARESVVESMSEGVVVVDSRDTVVDINPRAATVLDCDPCEAVGRAASALVPAYDRLLEAEGSNAAETVELEHGGRARYYEITMSGMADAHGRETGHVILIHDVSERRNRVKQLDVLNRVLRHNLRNEMNVIYGYAEQLPDTEPGARIRERAMAMADMGDKARKIDHVLNGGVGEEPIEVCRLLSIRLHQSRERYPAVDFEVSRPERSVQVPPTLGPVLDNLVENAAEHNASDDPRVWVDVSVHGDTVEIEIRDNGPGIPEEERAVLRTGEETPLEHSSGLGLWLVNWGVKRLGGSVTVDRTDGETVVRLSVPHAETRPARAE